MPYVCDLDGVIWLGAEPIAGAADAVARLRAAGERVVFVTNNAATPIAGQEEKLARMGIEAAGDVIGSAMAGAAMVEPGERVLVVGEAGIVEAIEARGAEVVREGPADVVLVGLDRAFDYDRMQAAAAAVRAGARFLATNGDTTFPTPAGLVPGAGSIVAAVAAAAGQDPVIAGKPHGPIAELVRAAVGPVGVVIGDRDDTDGAFARTLGFDFALVFSGVTRPGDEPTDPAPALVADDLASLVDRILG